MVQAYYTREYSEQKLTQRELLVLAEIGQDVIDSASSFVSYMSESYGLSKSSVWYNLNKLRELDYIEFEPGKTLRLTPGGVNLYNSMGSAKTKVIEAFSTKFLERFTGENAIGYRGEIETIQAYG